MAAIDVNATLTEREALYGDFKGHAAITQGIKRVYEKSVRWAGLDDAKREALEMIAHKIGRILNGDPHVSDSWHDVAGYATLIEKELAVTPVPAPVHMIPEPVHTPEPVVQTKATPETAPKPTIPALAPVKR